MKAKYIITFTIASTVISFSCSKGWLDAKPDQALVTLNTLKDLQALLDNTSVFNTVAMTPEQCADNYYISDTVYNLATERDRNVHTWSSSADFYAGTNVIEWNVPYNSILYSNTTLEKVNEITPDQKSYTDWANVRGSALFYRAYAFYNLAQLFCKPYVKTSASSDPGIILRLNSDVNIELGRSTVEETYSQIVKDLTEAKDLLPKFSATFKTRPSKHAAYAMLSRVYLTMSDFDNSLLYADSALGVSNALMNYSSDPEINPSATTNFTIRTRYNKEMIFLTRVGTTSTNISAQTNGRAKVDSLLLKSYDVNDRRRNIFFRFITARVAFRGSYDGSTSLFNGLATDEMYLNRAESHARKGDIPEALADLNTLLQSRWSGSVPYVPYDGLSQDEALATILAERRKELCFRNLRWTDLRRLNNDTRFAITLTRVIGSQVFELPPNDNNYVLPIPDSEVLYNSKVQQNPR